VENNVRAILFTGWMFRETTVFQAGDGMLPCATRKSQKHELPCCPASKEHASCDSKSVPA